MSDEPRIAMAGQMIEYDSRNHKGRHRHLKAGSIWLAEQEIDRETWDLLETIPPGAIIHHVAWWTDGDATGKEKAEVEPVQCERHGTWNRGPCSDCADGPAPTLPLPDHIEKDRDGPWGAFWNLAFIKKFYTYPALLEELHIKGVVNQSDRVRKALHARFHVDSLTQVSPDRMVCWLIEKRMPDALIKLFDRVEEELGGFEYKRGKSNRSTAA